MNSLQYDTPELLARFTAPSTLAEEVVRLRDALQTQHAATDNLWNERTALYAKLNELESKNALLTKLYHAVKTSGLRHNFLLRPIMDELEQA